MLVSAAPVGAQPNVLIPYLDTGWKYAVVPYDGRPGFESPAFDDSLFGVGDAGFGTEDFAFGCSLYHSPDLNTPWAPLTDILLRKTFTIPPGAGPVRVAVAIDDRVQVFVNGQDISGGFRSGAGCATRGQFVFAVPASVVHEGTNLLAVRARDQGSPNYVDVRVTAAASPEEPITLPPGRLTVPSSGTFLYLNSLPGEPIGRGIEQLFTSADSMIVGSMQQDGGWFGGSVFSAAHSYAINIAAPPGQLLVTGQYADAVRAAFRPPGTPGLDVYGDGLGCNTASGRFDINELSYALTGELLVFDATFEQFCDSFTAPLFGRIRIENPPPPPDLTPPTLYLPAAVTLEGPDSFGTDVSYGASASDDRDPNPTLTCAPASGSFFAVGPTTVNCQASDRSGNVATGSFQVNVYPPLKLGVTVNTSGNVSSKTGIATLSGIVTCSRAIGVDIGGTLKQLFAKRVFVTGTFATHLNCNAPSTKWTATVTAVNGKFGGGQADADVVASGCELSCPSASASRPLTLNGKN
jgi:hypothetical protein